LITLRIIFFEPVKGATFIAEIYRWKLEKRNIMTDSADNKRILVVEDEPSISSLCVRVLMGEGLEVSIAVDGRAAEEMLDRNNYDLCLIDIKTPVINGKEIFQYINDKHPELVNGVILTTGDVIGGETQSFLKETGRLFLLKPFAPEELRAIVKEALKSRGISIKN
jgi:DNA-binding NtrC family response regulator